MADTLLMSRPFSGRQVRLPPKKEPFPLVRGERLLWEIYLPPYDAQRKLERTIKIKEWIFISLTIGWLFSNIIGFAISPTFGSWIFAITFFPILIILIWQLMKRADAKDSLSNLQARYPLPALRGYQEYFAVTNGRVISRTPRNFERTSPESMQEIINHAGDVFTGNLSSMTKIQVKNHWFNKTTLRLTFENPAAAVPEMPDLSDYESYPQSAQYSWNFFPNLMRGIASYVYYSTFFASKEIFNVTLNTPEAQVAYGILKNILSRG